MASKTKQSNGGKQLLIGLIIAGAVAVGGYYIYNNNVEHGRKLSSGEMKTASTQSEKLLEELQGFWTNEEDGSTLSFNNNTFLMDFPSVEGASSIEGEISIKNDTVTFHSSSDSEICPNKIGVYTFQIEEDSFKANLVSDECLKRKKRLKYEWVKD